MLLLLAACGRLGFGDHEDASTAGPSDGGDGGNLPPFTPNWTNGTRFRARTLVVGDGGDPIYYGWRDTMLDTDCQSNVAADGVERCMPIHARADQYFADAACTVRLAWVHGMCGHDTFASAAIAGQYHAFPLTTTYTGPVYLLGATCGAVSKPSKGQLWSVGAESAPTMFAATKYRTTLVGGYNHVFGGFGDGSWLDFEALSFNQGTCNPTGGVATGPVTCKPNGDSVATAVYSDSGCMQRAFYSTDSAPTSEFYVNETSLCGVKFTVYDTTSMLPGPNYWTLDPVTGCTMQSVGTGKLLTGGMVDPYPHGTMTIGPHRGRIGYLYWDAGDGVPMPYAEWDFDNGRSCRPFIAQDGVVRCLPRTPKEIAASPDGACSALPTMVAANCYGVDPVDGVGYPSCDDGPVTMHTLAPIAAMSYYDEATCTPLGAGYDAATTNGTIAASAFPPLTEVIE